MMDIKAELPLQLKKEILHIRNLPPPLSVQATGVCKPIGNTEMLLAAAHKSQQIRVVWSDTDIAELLHCRKKTFLAGDLNRKHPVWNCSFRLLRF
jgi:hypothetical protein